MKKAECINRYKNIFKNIYISKVIPYRSPSDGKIFKLERINPDHVGIIWGKTKKQPSNFIQFAKVFFSVYPLSVGWGIISTILLYTDQAIIIIGSIGFLTLFLSFMVAFLYYLFQFMPSIGVLKCMKSLVY